MTRTFRHSLPLLLVIGLLSSTACVSRVSREAPLEQWTKVADAQAREALVGDRSSELLVLVAFSGGGTRAAAFAYGVLQELAATEVLTQHGARPLHREIDGISSVSGGSFTAAYFALKGDGLFEDFESRFLRKNIERSLVWQVVSPLNWFKLGSGGYGRSDLAADYYAKHVFDDATLADLQHPDRPEVVINATDLASGVRFTFHRSYFDLLCADIDSYPVSRAVAASSAVPGLLSPISLENYAGSCGYETNPLLLEAVKGERRTIQKAQAEVLMSFLDREQRPWLHLVDGGISDNLGLRAFWTKAAMAGGLGGSFPTLNQPGGHQVLLILVNAITKPVPKWQFLDKSPSLLEIVGSVSSIQLAHYDIDTIELSNESFARWAKESSRPDDPVSFHFVELGFDQVGDEAKRAKLNQIGTNFHLPDEQVDALIEAARELVRQSPEFGAFLEENRRRHARP